MTTSTVPALAWGRPTERWEERNWFEKKLQFHLEKDIAQGRAKTGEEEGSGAYHYEETGHLQAKARKSILRLQIGRDSPLAWGGSAAIWK